MHLAHLTKASIGKFMLAARLLYAKMKGPDNEQSVHNIDFLSDFKATFTGRRHPQFFTPKKKPNPHPYSTSRPPTW
jgi:hypothetical protein